MNASNTVHMHCISIEAPVDGSCQYVYGALIAMTYPVERNSQPYDRLREERERRGLTQEEAANYAGVTRNPYASWEKGATSPNLAQLGALRDVGFDVEYILTGERDPWATFRQFGEVGYHSHISMFERAAMALALGSVSREVPLTRQYADQVHSYYRGHLDALRELVVPWLAEVESRAWTGRGLSVQDYFWEWIEERLPRAVQSLYRTEAAFEALARGEVEIREIARQAKLAEPEIKRRVEEEIARRANRLRRPDDKA